MIALSRPVVFHGPSPFARVPAVVVDITLDEATNQHCETLRDELAAAFGAWFAPPDSGDLATSDAGIVQLLLNWSLAALTARGGCLELSGFRRIEASRFRAWIEFYDPAPLQMALKLAATTANAILAGQYDTNAVEAELQQLWNACARLHPGTSDCIIMHGARKLGIPYQSAWGTTKHWQFGWGARGEVFSFAASDRDG
ncbi:MAG: hypothetical protein KDE55_24025, partial [Novosphingobium sp.]|nr:hypothetical protein [Novosphingobium sp.]